MSRLRPAFLCALALLAASPAHAGRVNVPVDRPFVFPGATVNAVVMPYAYTGNRAGEVGSAGEQLSALVEFHTLLAMVKYGSVGAVQLVCAPERPCRSDDVLGRLTGVVPGAEATLQPFRGLVLLWGRLFEDGEDIFAQTYVTFLRRGVTEEIAFPVRGRKLVGRLSAQSFAFAPRRLTRADLVQVAREYRATFTLRPRPDDAAAGEALAPAGKPVGFEVVGVQGDWMELSSTSGGRGWLRAASPLGNTSLERRMPELAFVEGAAGFLALRVAAAEHVPPANGTREAALAALRRFESWSDDPASGTARGIARQLQAAILLDGRDPDLATASALLDGAATLMPGDPDARNLASMVRMAVSGDRGSLQRVAADMVGALALDPRNEGLLRNLESCYWIWLHAPPAPPSPSPPASTPTPAPAPTRWDPGEITQRMQAVRDVLDRRNRVDDDTIHVAVRRALSQAGLGSVEVASVGGKVTLSGEVASPEAKSRAETLARAVNGVVRVESAVSIKPPR